MRLYPKGLFLMSDLLGEMYGDHAVQAPCLFVASYREPVNGIGRTMFGGIVLSDFCLTKKWERWFGTVIIIPKRIEFVKAEGAQGMRIDQMMVGPMQYSEEPDSVAYWKTKWTRA